MKNNIILVLAGTAAYSYLFYEQDPGINQLVFSVLFTTLFAINNPLLLKEKRWWAGAALYLASGVLTALNGTALNLLMNLGGMGLVAYLSAAAELSIITGMLYAFLSGLSASFVLAAHRLQQYVTIPQPGTETKKEKKYKWYYLLLPLGVIVFFVFLYREVSAGFADLTNQVTLIDLGFISVPWIAFTCFGLHLMFGLLNPPAQFGFFRKEVHYPNTIAQPPLWASHGFVLTGLTMFVLLDVLLLIVNLSDITYMVVPHERIGLSHAQIIHQGVGALVVSLLFAVAFILVWLNQPAGHNRLYKKLRLAAGIWVWLNLGLVVTNCLKNYAYIEAHGLTYLRIGVFFFLLLSLLTLFFCWMKIRGQRTNFYIYRRFGLVLLACCFVFNLFNWDRVIVQYNLAQYKKGNLEPDLYYMMQRSDDCLPELFENREAFGFSSQGEFNVTFTNRAQRFINAFENSDWRSHTLNHYRVYRYLKQHSFSTQADTAQVNIN